MNIKPYPWVYFLHFNSKKAGKKHELLMNANNSTIDYTIFEVTPEPLNLAKAP